MTKEGSLQDEKQYDTLSEHYVEGFSNSITAYKEYFEREEERVSKLLLSTPHPFIRLTDEEIKTLADSGLSPDWTDEFEIYHFARAIEDALAEKNNAF